MSVNSQNTYAAQSATMPSRVQLARWLEELRPDYADNWEDEPDYGADADAVADTLFPVRWEGLSPCAHFDRLVLIYKAGFGRIAHGDGELAGEYEELAGLCMESQLDAFLYGGTRPDVPTLVSCFRALSLYNPGAGLPVAQTDYDRYFRVFNAIYDSLPDSSAEKHQLSQVRNEYHDMLMGRQG